MKDLYKVLEVDRKASIDVIEKAYGDYLTKNGYKVAFRVNWRKLPIY